jgi:predicted ATP-dependent serine protease
MVAELAEPTLQQIMRMRVRPMMLSKRWRDFLGNLPADSGWSIQVTGAPGTGKSTWSLMFADEMQRHGKLLYAFAEEVHQAGTIQERAKKAKVRMTPNLVIPEVTRLSMIRAYLDTGKYRFCIVDSINTIEDATDFEVTSLTKAYPEIGFLFVAQTTKDRRRSRGDGRNEHNVYATFQSIRRENARFIVAEKNRYGGTVNEFFVFSS